MSRSSLPIRYKLAAIVVLFLIPVGLLTCLFVQQSLKDIDFAGKERDGVTYLRSVWPVLTGLIDGVSGVSAATDRAPKAQDLAAAGRSYDAAMGTEDAGRALREALQAAGWPGHPLSRGPASEKATAAAKDLLGKVADGSNLTLDPDLDSFYVMDVATTKLPDAIDRLGTLIGLARTYRTQERLSDDQKAEMMIEIGLFDGAVAGASSSVESAYKGSVDGSVKRNVGAAAESFARAADAFSTEFKRLATAYRDDDKRRSVSIGALEGLDADTSKALDAYWRAASDDLDRLLAARIGGFLTRLWTMLGISGAVVVVAIALAWWFARSILVSINGLDVRIRELGDGDVNAAIPEAAGRDEIAQIARAVGYFRDRTIQKIAEADSDERRRALLAQERHAMAKIAERLRSSVGAIIEALRNMSGMVEKSTKTVVVAAQTTRQGLGSAADDLNTASNDVTTVVSAVTELSASIAEISTQAARSAKDIDTALVQVEATKTVAATLADAIQRIGQISGLIQDIASQTNLLALNATIEAARAGDAGRGFAVVASEVKNLAGQTTKATEEIERHVKDVRGASQQVLTAVGEITGSIGNITSISTTIASAVEEQNVATQEISQSLNRANDATQGAVRSINQLPATASEAESAASSLANLSADLTDQAERLNGEIETLLRELADRRTQPRYPADAPVEVIIDGRSQSSRLADISTTGAKIVLVPGIDAGKMVTIVFPDRARLTSRAVWKNDRVFGVNFDATQLEAAQLDAMARDRRAA